MRKFYSSIGPQSESTKASAPIIKIGSAPAREEQSLEEKRAGPGSYKIVSTLTASHPTLPSPGYTVFSRAKRQKNELEDGPDFPAGERLSRVVISTVKSAPSISFGSSTRPNYGKQSATLNANLMPLASVHGMGKNQPLSHKRNAGRVTIAGRTKLCGDRVTAGDAEVPGPCYLLPATIGNLGNKFGTSNRMKMSQDDLNGPGPGQYQRPAAEGRSSPRCDQASLSPWQGVRNLDPCSKLTKLPRQALVVMR